MITTMELHPEILTKDGAKFAVLPYDEFLRLQEMLEDAQDLFDLEQAIQEDRDGPSIPLDDLLKDFGLPTGA